MFSLAMLWPAIAARKKSIPVDDQTYIEAVMEDALRESDAAITKLVGIAKRAGDVHANLARASEHLKIVSADKQEVVARAARRV